MPDELKPNTGPAYTASAELLALLGDEPEQEFNDIAELAAAICGTPISLLTVLDGAWQFHKAAVGIEVSKIPESESFCRHTIQSDGVFTVADASIDARFADNPYVVGAPHIRFYAGLPVYAPTGERVGALCVIDTIRRELKKSQLHALDILARQINQKFELRLQRWQAETALNVIRSSDEQFSAFANNIPFICYTKDRSGRFTFLNTAACKHFEIGPSEWIGKTSREVWASGDVADRLEIEEERVFQKWKASDVEVEIPKHEVATYWSMRRAPFYSRNGEPMLAVFATDITETVMHREAALTLLSSRQELNRMDVSPGIRSR